MKHIFELRMKDTTWAVAKRKPEKKKKPNSGSRSSLNFFFRLSFRNCSSCVVTARIFLLFDLSSAVQIYVSYIYIHLFILHGYITNSQYDQLPVGLIAQLVEHCTGIAEVMGSNPVQAKNFFQAFFSQLLKLCSNCEDLSSIWELSLLEGLSVLLESLTCN